VYDLKIAPKDGVYVWGLFLEGCKWCSDVDALEESDPKVLFSPMKPIWICPKIRTEID